MEVEGEKGKISAVTLTPPGSCSFQFLYPVISSDAEDFLGILHMSLNYFQMASGLWMKKWDMSGCRSSFNTEATQQLEELICPFTCHHFGHRSEGDTPRNEENVTRKKQAAATCCNNHVHDRGMYVQSCAERQASHLMPLEP